MKTKTLACIMFVAVVFAMFTACTPERVSLESHDDVMEVSDKPAPTMKSAYVPQEQYIEEYYEEEYYEPVYYGGGGYGNSFQSEGVRYDGDTRYTWYSQNVLPGGGLTELNSNGRHVDSETGFIMDGDGYIAVASSDHPIGTVVDTPWGEAKVYDSGCASGTIDVYTDF